MRLYTSYFYQIRNMDKTIIPLSTAIWDPQWYHNGKGKSYAYKDKNGVYVGLRAEPFVPGPRCSNLCRGLDNCFTGDPKSCDFLREYYKQLNELDINEVLEGLTGLAAMLKDQENLNTLPDIALIFHEAPDNPCSERWVVQRWFREHHYEISEWTK